MAFVVAWVAAATVVTIIVAVVVIVAVVLVVTDLLGMLDDQVIELFDVHNQPLFASDTIEQSNQNVATALFNDIPLADYLLIHAAYAPSISVDLRKFITYIDDDNYFSGFPEVTSFMNYVDTEEVLDVLNTLEGPPCSLQSSKLGGLSITTWIRYWLQENKGYDYTTNTLIEPTISALPLVVQYTDYTYNEATDDYSVSISLTGEAILLPYVIPSKPIGSHYTIVYIKDNDPVVDKLFIYKTGTGTYPELDNPTIDVDTDADALQVLPAIPLRVNNVNYNTTPSTRTDQINELCGFLNLQPDGILSSILDNHDGDINDLDHIYLNFGVRMWDTTQAGMTYLFNVFQNLYSGGISTQGDYDSTSSSDDKPYNAIAIISEDYRYAFKFSYINYTHTPLADINSNPSSIENEVYYSQPKFFEGTTLVKTYYASSGQATYNLKYAASNATEVQDFLDGNGHLAPGATASEAGEWLQVTERFAWSGNVYDKDFELVTGSQLQPFKIYRGMPNTSFGSYNAESWGYAYGETDTPDNIISMTLTTQHSNSVCALDQSFGILDSNSGIWADHGCRGTFSLRFSQPGYNGDLQEVDTATDATFIGQHMTYYQIVPNGLNAYTVQAPTGVFNVRDTESSKYKMVNFNLANRDDLMVPLFYSQLQGISKEDVGKLWLTSSRVTVMVAHYEVIEVDIWSLVLMIVLIIIIVYVTMGTGAPGSTNPGITSVLKGSNVQLATMTSAETGAPMLVNSANGIGVTGDVLVTSSLGITYTTPYALGVAIGPTSIAWAPTAISFATNLIINQMINLVVQEIAEESPLVGFIVAVGLHMNFGIGKDISFDSIDLVDVLKLSTITIDSVATVTTVVARMEAEEEAIRHEKAIALIADTDLLVQEELDKIAALTNDRNTDTLEMLDVDIRGVITPIYPEKFYAKVYANKLYDNVFNISGQIDYKFKQDFSRMT